MFTTEQKKEQKGLKTDRNGLFGNGTPLASKRIVKFRLSFREVTIALGILVAIVVFFLTYSNTTAATAIGFPAFKLPSVSNQTLVNTALRLLL